MDNEGKLPNDFVAWRKLRLIMTINLKFLFFQHPRPHEYISPSCSYDLLLDYGVTSYSHPFNQMSFQGVSDPFFHTLMINPHFDARDALWGDMVSDDSPFLLAPLRVNDENKKLVVKASYDLKHDMIVVSKDIFVKEEYSRDETYDDEVVEVMSCDLELVDPISIKCRLKSILLLSCPLHCCFTLP